MGFGCFMFGSFAPRVFVFTPRGFFVLGSTHVVDAEMVVDGLGRGRDDREDTRQMELWKSVHQWFSD